MLLVRRYASSGIKIRQNLIPKDFYKELRRLIESGRDFTTSSYLLELIQYIPKFTIVKECKYKVYSIGIYQKPPWLSEVPINKVGSLELVHYMNDINGNFKGLFQLFSICFQRNSNSKTYDDGDLILLQIINKVMIIWSPNDNVLAPCFWNLNNLQSFHISETKIVRIEFSKEKKINTSFTTEESNSKNLVEIVLSRNELIPIFLQILRSAIMCNTKKISVASMAVSGNSQHEEKPQKLPLQVLRNPITSTNAFSVTSDSDSFYKSKTFLANKSQQNVNLNNPSLKSKLRSYNNEKNPIIPPPKFFGEESVSPKNVKSRKSLVQSKNPNQDKKWKGSKGSTLYSSQLDNIVSTPSKLLNDFQKVSKRYGKKPTRQSHKRDIWDFSSSIPSSPQNEQNCLVKAGNSGDTVESVRISESVVSDSQIAPSILLPIINKCNNVIENNTFQGLVLAAKPSEGTISNASSSLSSLNVTSSNILANTRLEPNSHKNINVTQVHDSLAGDSSSQSNSKERDLNYIIPEHRVIHSSSYRGERLSHLDQIGRMSLENSTSLSEEERKIPSDVTGNIKRIYTRSPASENRKDNSILENTTAKTSFPDYSTKEYDINKQYSLIYDGLNLLSANLITRIKKFENEIFLKQKALHDELEDNFKLIAKSHCENLKRFNSYVTKKSDELFRNLTE